jgi:hypothetical protein
MDPPFFYFVPPLTAFFFTTRGLQSVHSVVPGADFLNVTTQHMQTSVGEQENSQTCTLLESQLK